MSDFFLFIEYISSFPYYYFLFTDVRKQCIVRPLAHGRQNFPALFLTSHRRYRLTVPIIESTLHEIHTRLPGKRNK